MFQKDYCDKEFERLVILGESTVQGGGWLQRQDQRFGDIIAQLIDACQAKPVEYFNEGVSASVISPRSPGYDDSAKPSAMERYRERVIARRPDLFVFCYGLNDMRCGNPVDAFIEDMDTILVDVKTACSPVIVLTTVYHMTGFDRYAPFNVGSVEVTKEYNRAIAALAEKRDCILADVWEAEGMADHLIHPDGVHANAVGSILIANKVFEAIARSCSGISAHTQAIDQDTEWGRHAAKVAHRERGNEVKDWGRFVGS
ncbi:MAG: SGNH/GDSL hydrolase family protein [Armatimonadota bacterium]|nr:SGNH/GDSL hydrolase family protein [Armatimonadota bacterium]